MWVELFLNRSANRASAGTRTATNTLVSVDYILAVTLSDALARTSFCACAASDALVCNFVCHLYKPPFRFYNFIVAHFFYLSIDFYYYLYSSSLSSSVCFTGFLPFAPEITFTLSL